MSYQAIYTYAWDLADEGVAAVIGHVSAARPRHGDDRRQLSRRQVPASARQGAERSTSPTTARSISTPTRRAMARSSRSPTASLGERDVLRELTGTAAWPSMSGWCCCTTRGSAWRIRESAVRNAFGDPYCLQPLPLGARGARLCRRRSARDVTESYPVAGISLETPGFMPYAHGYHHEFALMKSNPWLESRLGLCFCDHCVAGAEKPPASMRAGSRRGCAADIEAYLDSDIDFPADMAEAFWLRRHRRRRRLSRRFSTSATAS